MSSYLQTAAEHGPKKRFFELRINFKLRAHHFHILVTVSVPLHKYRIGMVQLLAPVCRLLLDTVCRSQSLGCTLRSTHSLVQLSAHFCRLLLVTVHTSKSLGCTSTSSCEHMSIRQYTSHCLCFVVVNTTAFIWESAFTC